MAWHAEMVCTYEHEICVPVHSQKVLQEAFGIRVSTDIAMHKNTRKHMAIFTELSVRVPLNHHVVFLFAQLS